MLEKLRRSLIDLSSYAAEWTYTARFRLIRRYLEARLRAAGGLRGRPAARRCEKVLAVIVHVVDRSKDNLFEGPFCKLARLEHTLLALHTHLAHCELEVAIVSTPGRHLFEELPRYLREAVRLVEHSDVEPLYVGFRAQDEFMRRKDAFDWFMFLEDDSVLTDSSLLDKLRRFNEVSGSPRCLLLPNRYEIYERRKSWIDLGLDVGWNDRVTLSVDGIRYARPENPHAAFYCLNREQLALWESSGRKWYGETVFFGPLESAATGCLLECFQPFKAAPPNEHYLEIRHWDLRYAEGLEHKS